MDVYHIFFQCHDHYRLLFLGDQASFSFASPPQIHPPSPLCLIKNERFVRDTDSPANFLLTIYVLSMLIPGVNTHTVLSWHCTNTCHLLILMQQIIPETPLNSQLLTNSCFPLCKMKMASTLKSSYDICCAWLSCENCWENTMLFRVGL